MVDRLKYGIAIIAILSAFMLSVAGYLYSVNRGWLPAFLAPSGYQDTNLAVKQPPQPAHATSSPKTQATPPFSPDEFLIDLNNLRVQHGLQPLARIAALDQIAQAHAQDMQTRGYYSHTTPEGVTAYSRIRAVMGQNVYAGENEDVTCAYVAPLTEFNRFSTSPEHQLNQLEPHYNRVGLGYIASKRQNPCNGYFVLDFSS